MKSLPLGKQIAFSIGRLGWSITLNGFMVKCI